MKSLKRFFLYCLGLGLMVPLAACQQVSTKPEAASASQPVERVTFEHANRCIKALELSDVGQLVFTQVLYSKSVAPEHKELLVSNKTINDAQGTVLGQFIEKNKTCRTLRLQAFDDYELRQVLSEHYERMDALFAALLSKQLTIGQANAQLNANFERYQATIKKIINRSREVDEDRVG